MDQDKIEKLKQLSELYKAGILTKEEVEQEKNKILGKSDPSDYNDKSQSVSNTKEELVKKENTGCKVSTQVIQPSDTNQQAPSRQKVYKNDSKNEGLFIKYKLYFIGLGAIILIGSFIWLFLILNRTNSIDNIEEEAQEINNINSDYENDTSNKQYNLTQYVKTFPNDFSIKEIGRNWNWKDPQEGSVILYGEGTLNDYGFRTIFRLEDTGYIYGRYYNSTGVQMDLNGFIESNGNMKFQLGHNKDVSNMILSPFFYNDESGNEIITYNGTWQQKNKTLPVTIDFGVGKAPKSEFNFKHQQRERFNYVEWGDSEDPDTIISKHEANYTLPVDRTGKILPFIDIKIKQELNSTQKLNIYKDFDEFINDYISRDNKGSLLKKVKNPPEYAQQEIWTTIKPLISNSNYIIMQISDGMTMGAGSIDTSQSYLFPLDMTEYPTGFINNKDIFVKGKESLILNLINSYRPAESLEAYKIPRNIVLNEDEVQFLFEKGEIGAAYQGEIKVNVPLSEIKQYINPKIKELITTATNWTTQIEN